MHGCPSTFRVIGFYLIGFYLIGPDVVGLDVIGAGAFLLIHAHPPLSLLWSKVTPSSRGPQAGRAFAVRYPQARLPL